MQTLLTKEVTPLFINKEIMSTLKYTQYANNMWLVLGFQQIYTNEWLITEILFSKKHIGKG